MKPPAIDWTVPPTVCLNLGGTKVIMPTKMVSRLLTDLLLPRKATWASTSAAAKKAEPKPAKKAKGKKS